MATEEVQCPVCDRFFDTSKVNAHVNMCLNSKTGISNQTFPKKPHMTTIKTDCPQISGSPAKRKYGVDTENTDADCTTQKKSKWSFFMKPQQNSSGIKDLGDLKKKINVNETDISDRCNSSSTSDSVSNTNENKLPVHSKIPLAERMRPANLTEYIGQEQALGRNKLIRSLLEANRIPSMILWGPPGCGKTTLAKIVAAKCKETHGIRFTHLSATTSGVADVKEAVKVAKNEWKLFKRSTVLFIDEIHRFNKLQQDSFLPHVEDGTIVLIGATTENPSFHINNALLSRCRVLTLEKLTCAQIITILKKSARALGVSVQSSDLQGRKGEKEVVLSETRAVAVIEDDAIQTLANFCDGDARAALNNFENVLKSKITADELTKPTKHNKDSVDERPPIITVDDVKDGLLQSHLQYDRNGEEHYNMASALQKSIRGSDDNAAIYWMTRMLEGGEDPLFIARRLVVTASEDIGMADLQALPLAVSTFQACTFIGRPECSINLAHCVTYLSRAPKSCESFKAMQKAKEYIHGNEGPQPAVPLHLRNAPTKLMKNLGYGNGYKYNHNPAYKGQVDQDYLPEELKGINFFSD